MFHHILVPLDGSTLAECVLPHVVAVARACEASVTLLHVVECAAPNQATAPVDPLTWEVCKAEAQAYLDGLTQRLQAVALPIDTVLLEGQPAPRIVDYVREHDCDLIALSSHGEGGVSSWNIGTIVHKLVQGAHLSALIVRAYRPLAVGLTELHYQRILAPLDGSPRADCAIAPAAHLAHSDGAQLILAYVIERPSLFPHLPPPSTYAEVAEELVAYNRRAATHYFTQLQARFGENVSTRVVIGDDVAERLHQLIEEEAIDLTVVSAHGKTGKPHWPFGSVSTNLILYGAAPLLVIQDLTAVQLEPTHAERFARERAGH